MEKLKGNLKSIKTKQIIDILLSNRGIKTTREKEEFVNPTVADKLSLKELRIKETEVKKAIKRILMAKKLGQKVIIYGDYDTDGICATAIVWESLYSLGINAYPYLPDRFSEGYGIKGESVSKLKKEDEKVKLIITVDNGIVAHEEIEKINKLGIDVIVCDHHTPKKNFPKAHAIVHTTEICGAAIAWILVRELNKKVKNSILKEKINDLLGLAAIGTISDQMPLVGKNRSFAKYGLTKLRETKRAGLLALFKIAGVNQSKIGTYEVNYLIAPRINASGRLEHAIDSLRLLCTPVSTRASALALHLNKVNEERQKLVDEVVSHARVLIQKKGNQKILILANESYHQGVIGLAASKLVEEFYRPAVVLFRGKEISKASARSITGFNIIKTLQGMWDLLEEGGGHPMAAGFSIKTEKIDEFSQRFEKESLKLLTDEILSPKLKIDLELPFDQINESLLEELLSFEPFGVGNPHPLFISKKVKVLQAKALGEGGKHLRLVLKKQEKVFEAIAFNWGAFITKLSREALIDIVYSVEENTWNGAKNLQLKVKDMKVSQ